jgi:arylsulfatase A-like enzyme
MDEGHHPLDQGFDYYYGTPSSNDTPAPSRWKHNYELFRTCEKDTFPIDLIRMRDVIECPADQELFIQRYTAEAGRFISAQMNTPFFLYLAHNAPHVPVFPSEAFRGTSRSGRYGDVVRELDWSVGQLVALLAHEGILENTLVLFTSDNGPWTMFWEFGGTAWPLRGEKATAWEGGTRVPAIASMPGSIDSGVSSEFVVSLDLYATFARLAGVSIDRGVAVDSLDMHDVLFHRAASPRTSYLYCAYDRPFSYRSGDHKVHLRSIERMRDPHTCEPSRVTEYETPLVFDVRHDISEKRDLSGSRADTRDRLVQEARVASRALGSECR